MRLPAGSSASGAGVRRGRPAGAVRARIDLRRGLRQNGASPHVRGRAWGVCVGAARGGDCRDTARPSHLCAGAALLRGGRGAVADRGRRRALSRPRRRHRRHRPRACASGAGGGAGGAGAQALAHLEPLPDPEPAGAGRAAGRRDLRRHRLRDQLRNRGDRMRDQDGAQALRPHRPAGADPHHRLRGVVPRPQLRGDLGGGVGEDGQGLRADGAGLRPCALRRPRGDRERDPAGDGGGADRADPGRGRHPGAVARGSAGAARALRRARAPARSSTRSSAAWGGPGGSSTTSGPGSPPTS